MSISSSPDAPSSTRSTRAVACALMAMIAMAMLAWEFQSSHLNDPPLRWLFPGTPFVILSGLALIQRIPLGVPVGGCVGGLLPVAVLYRAILSSTLNYNGGGANIGVGLLWLGAVVLLPLCMFIGGGIGLWVDRKLREQHSNHSRNVFTPTV